MESSLLELTWLLILEAYGMTNIMKGIINDSLPKCYQ